MNNGTTLRLAACSCLAVALAGCGGGSSRTSPAPVLTVAAVSPEPLAAGVPVLAPVEVQFVTALDPLSVPGSLTVDDGYGAVDGTLTYDPAALRLRFAPAREYGHDAAVVATLAPSLRAADGRPLEGGYEWMFVTQARAWSALPDLGPSPRSTRPKVAVGEHGESAVGWEDRVSVWDPEAQVWLYEALGGTTFTSVDVLGVAFAGDGEAFAAWLGQRKTASGFERMLMLSARPQLAAWDRAEIANLYTSFAIDSPSFQLSAGALGHVQLVAHVYTGVPSGNRGTGYWSAPAQIAHRTWIAQDFTGPSHDAVKAQVRLAADGSVTSLHQPYGSEPPTLRYSELQSGTTILAAVENGTLATAADGTSRIVGIAGSGQSASVTAWRRAASLGPAQSVDLPVAQMRRSFLAGCGNGDLILVVEERLDESTSKLVGVGYDAGKKAWTQPQVLFPALPRSDLIDLSLSAGPRGDGWLTFRRALATGDLLSGMRYRPRRGFGAEQTLVRSDPALGMRSYDLAVDGSGRTTVAWTDFVMPPLGIPILRAARYE